MLNLIWSELLNVYLEIVYHLQLSHWATWAGKFPFFPSSRKTSSLMSGVYLHGQGAKGPSPSLSPTFIIEFLNLKMYRALRTCGMTEVEDAPFPEYWGFQLYHPLSPLHPTFLFPTPLSWQILMSANWVCTPVGKMPPVQIRRETTPAHVLATHLNLDGFALVGWWVVQIQGEGLDSEKISTQVYFH